MLHTGVGLERPIGVDTLHFLSEVADISRWRHRVILAVQHQDARLRLGLELLADLQKAVKANYAALCETHASGENRAHPAEAEADGAKPIAIDAGQRAHGFKRSSEPLAQARRVIDQRHHQRLAGCRVVTTFANAVHVNGCSDVAELRERLGFALGELVAPAPGVANHHQRMWASTARPRNKGIKGVSRLRVRNQLLTHGRDTSSLASICTT